MPLFHGKNKAVYFRSFLFTLSYIILLSLRPLRYVHQRLKEFLAQIIKDVPFSLPILSTICPSETTDAFPPLFKYFIPTCTASGQLTQWCNQKIKCLSLPAVLHLNAFWVPGAGKMFRVLQCAVNVIGCH